MARHAPRRRHRVSRFQAYYRTAAWYARRNAVRRRAHGRCEYCGVQPMEHVHHRTYAHFGDEPLHDLMAVCRKCHGTIHGRLPWERRPPCTPGSLRAQGDRGLGHSVMWTRYLHQCGGNADERAVPRRAVRNPRRRAARA